MSPSRVKIRSHIPSAQLSLFNYQGRTITRAAGAIDLACEQGIYELQVDGGSEITRRFIAVSDGVDLDEEVDAVVRAAAPVSDAATFSPDHAREATALTKKSSISLGSGSRLLIFVRSLEGEGIGPLGPTSFRLLDEDLSELPIGATAWVSGQGFTAVSADIDPGCYVLRTSSERGDIGEWSVDQTLVCNEGWTTMAFIPWGRGALEFSVEPSESGGTFVFELAPDAARPNDLTVHQLAIGSAFEADGPIAASVLAAEIALQGLRNGESFLPPGGIDAVVTEMALNPMLGVYAAHALLLQYTPPLHDVDRIVSGLRALVPHHPDVEALAAGLADVAGSHGGQVAPSRVDSISLPPMLRSGLQMYVHRDTTEDGLVIDGSIAESVANKLVADSIWSRWQSDAVVPKVTTVATGVVDSAAAAIREIVEQTDLEALTNEFLSGLSSSTNAVLSDPSAVAWTIAGVILEAATSDNAVQQVAGVTGADRERRAEGADTDALGDADTSDETTAAEAKGTLVAPQIDAGIVPLDSDTAQLANYLASLQRDENHDDPSLGAHEGAVSIGHLSRQLGLPASAVRKSLIEIGEASAMYGSTDLPDHPSH